MDGISTGISRRGFVLGGVTAGVAAMVAGGLDTSIVGLIRGYACRRGFQLFHVLLILKSRGKCPRHLEAFLTENQLPYIMYCMKIQGSSKRFRTSVESQV